MSAPLSPVPPPPHEGACLCGAIRYEFRGAPLGVYACHCADCQAFTSAGYQIVAGFARESLALLEGAPQTWAKTADSGRVIHVRFCGRCGMRLWHEPQASPGLIVAMSGGLKNRAWLVPAAHVWVKSKLPHVHIPPGDLQIEGQAGDRQTLFDAWAARIAAA